MLRKVSATVAGAFLISGLAVAQETSTFPFSVSETGSNLPIARDGQTYNPFGRFAAGRWEVPEPSSVSESMPEMTGGQTHPTMGPGRARTRDIRAALDEPWPASVNESMPEMTGDQTHPTMGR
jgi:hypothetical protein